MTDDAAYYVDGPVPETPKSPGEPRPWGSTGVVGTRRPRVDGYERVSGTAVYPSDVVLPGMLYGAILRCPHAHARVRSVDASAAESMPGVVAVLTGDSPETKDLQWGYGGGMRTKLFDPHCRHEGEAVAAVAAETPYQARDALKAIRVDYEVLPFVVDEREALAADAPKVHDSGNRVGEPTTYERGDVEAGFAVADFVVERSFRTECELHTPLELHGCVARWDGDHLTLWESTQGVYSVQRWTAAVLGLPLAKVRVIGHYVGGGFGSKLQPSKHTVLAAVLARKAARPVKLFLSREETYLCVGNRPPANMTVKAGITKDGKLTAIRFTGLGTGGAYPAGGTSLMDWLARDLYACPNVKTELTDVFVNAGPSRPMRAPGHPQGAWALEQVMDELAERIGICGLDLRLKNIPTVSQARDGQPYTTTGLEECIREGAKAFGWEELYHRDPGDGPVRRGVGMAACLWIAGDGGPPSTVVVKLFADGSVNLNMGASDIGTGTKSVMAMVVAEELGVDPDGIQIEHADTGTTQYATPSGGSKTIPTEAPTVRRAALAVKEQILDLAAAQLEVAAGDLELRDGVVSTPDGSQSVKITELEGLRRRGVILGVGYRGDNPEGKVVNPFAAQFCEVEVDMRTGEVKILRFLGAHDSGRVMNRLTFDNQVFGGITMGIGLAATEQRILDRASTGTMVNANWHDYKVPTMLDVPPEMVSVPIDRPDPEANPSGAKGLGEPVTIPTAAAVANAVYHATGVRVTDSPITPMQLSRLLAERTEED
ncbi:MAG: xanthine dehydrogenase family protein molybdopterin-binding subunit [Acidobacteriota bacterium]|jgi:xanthine dehydrogenase YagR molybdenum-binding subunit